MKYREPTVLSGHDTGVLMTFLPAISPSDRWDTLESADGQFARVLGSEAWGGAIVSKGADIYLHPWWLRSEVEDYHRLIPDDDAALPFEMARLQRALRSGRCYQPYIPSDAERKQNHDHLMRFHVWSDYVDEVSA